jgi:hypothetical protein
MTQRTEQPNPDDLPGVDQVIPVATPQPPPIAASATGSISEARGSEAQAPTHASEVHAPALASEVHAPALASEMHAPAHAPAHSPALGAASAHDPAHTDETLGPIDVPAWSAGLLGAAIALFMAACFVLATAGIGAF